MKLSIIIPLYNEEENINNLLEEFVKFSKKEIYKIIIIDDGSTDDCVKMIKTSDIDNIKLVEHKLNRGYGAAIKTGIMKADTEYCITMDADGQHSFEDVEKLYKKIIETDADMIVGSRKGSNRGSLYRRFGKFLIRNTAKLMMPLKIYDINSGMKIFRTDLAKKYIHLYPDSMAFSDIICLIFVHNRHLVLEEPITVRERKKGKSTIGIKDAIQTFYEIINVVMLFSPMRIFLPVSILLFILGILWGIRFFIKGLGVSIGSSLLIISSLIIFFMGLISEQLSALRKKQ